MRLRGTLKFQKYNLKEQVEGHTKERRLTWSNHSTKGDVPLDGRWLFYQRRCSSEVRQGRDTGRHGTYK